MKRFSLLTNIAIVAVVFAGMVGFFCGWQIFSLKKENAYLQEQLTIIVKEAEELYSALEAMEAVPFRRGSDISEAYQMAVDIRKKSVFRNSAQPLE